MRRFVGLLFVIGLAFSQHSNAQILGISIFPKQTLVPLDEELPPSASSRPNMGSGVALVGNRAIVGMAGYDSARGRLAVFDLRYGEYWRRVATLSPPSGVSGLGTTVAFNGLVVGASGGRTLVFYRHFSDGWRQTATFIAPDTNVIRFESLKSAGPYFVGSALSYSHSTASHDVYVIEVDNAGRVLSYSQLRSPDLDPEFGTDVAVGGGVVAVGSPGSSNSVYMFTKTQGSWRQSARIEGGANSLFGLGRSVSTDGRTLLASDSSESQLGVGRVDVFDNQNGVWTFTQVLAGPEWSVGAYARFGLQVVLSGNLALVTGRQIDSDGDHAIGEIDVYERYRSQLWELRRIIWDAGAPAALDGDHLLYGRDVPLPNTDGNGGVDYVLYTPPSWP